MKKDYTKAAVWSVLALITAGLWFKIITFFIFLYRL